MLDDAVCTSRPVVTQCSSPKPRRGVPTSLRHWCIRVVGRENIQAEPASTCGYYAIASASRGVLTHALGRQQELPRRHPTLPCPASPGSVELSIPDQPRAVMDVLQDVETRLSGLGERFPAAEERLSGVDERTNGVTRRANSLEERVKTGRRV